MNNNKMHIIDKEQKYKIVYDTVCKLLRERGKLAYKKHGEIYFIPSKNGRKYLTIDTWNGYINLINEAYPKEKEIKYKNYLDKSKGAYFVYTNFPEVFRKGKLMGKEVNRIGNFGKYYVLYLEKIVNAYKFIIQNI